MTIIWVIILLAIALEYRHTSFALFVLIFFVYLVPIEGGATTWQKSKHSVKQQYDSSMHSAKRGKPIKLPRKTR